MADSFARVKHIVGSSAAWSANNIVLGDGEIGVERVSSSDIRIKIGDGSTAWATLPYASSSSTGINASVQAALDAKVAKSGDTMTGLLVLSGNPSAALGAATKQYVDAINSALTTSINGKLSLSGGSMTGTLALAADPASALQAATKQYVDTSDNLKVNKSGDTLTGALTLSADPTSALHAATKQYVDGGAYQTSVGGSSTYAGKVVKLNSGGLLDSSLLPVSATYLGTVNLTMTYGLSGSFVAGNYYAVSATGTIDSSWATRLNGSPTTCSAGQSIIYNGTTSKWDLVGDTTSSTAIAGKLDKAGGTMTGALILAADPTVALGAATKQYADTMVAKAGSTMTGLLVLSANPSAALGAATKQYVDAADTAVTSAYQAADTALSSTLTTSINGKLSTTGGTLTGALVLAADPITALGAATKQYVDTVGSGAALRANNLSDLSNATTARSNLGLGSIALLSSIGTANITNSAVTYAKIQNVSATARIIGRKTAAAGVMEEMTLSETLDLIGSAAQGDILYRGSTGWARLPAGTAGQVLKTNGAGADPVWTTQTSGGGWTSMGVQTGNSTQTYFDFIGIPSTAKAFLIQFSFLKQSGSQNYYIQLGNSSGIETGIAYTSLSATITATGISQAYANTAFVLDVNSSTTTVLSGAITMSQMDTLKYVVGGSVMDSVNVKSCLLNGYKTMASTLDRIRITTANGTATFVSGSVNVLYQ